MDAEKKKKAMVAWSNICYPFLEGGLGIRDLRVCNSAANMRHIWTVLTNNNNLCSQWVKRHFFERSEFRVPRGATGLFVVLAKHTKRETSSCQVI